MFDHTVFYYNDYSDLGKNKPKWEWNCLKRLRLKITKVKACCFSPGYRCLFYICSLGWIKTQQSKPSNGIDTNTDIQIFFISCNWGYPWPHEGLKLSSIQSSSLRWPFRCHLKERVTMLISDAEGATSQSTTGGTQGRAEYESCNSKSLKL